MPKARFSRWFIHLSSCARLTTKIPQAAKMPIARVTILMEIYGELFELRSCKRPL